MTKKNDLEVKYYHQNERAHKLNRAAQQPQFPRQAMQMHHLTTTSSSPENNNVGMPPGPGLSLSSTLSAAAGDDGQNLTDRAHLASASGKLQMNGNQNLTDEDMEEKERFILFVRVLLR